MSSPLAQTLVTAGLLPQKVVEQALRRQEASGGCLDTALLELRAVSETGILQVLADVSGQRAVNLADFDPNPAVAGLLPGKVCDRLGVVPLSLDGQTLHVACIYPPPGQELEEVAFLLGKQLERWVAVECRIRSWLQALYGLPLSPRLTALLQGLTHPEDQPPIPLSTKKRKAASQGTPPPPGAGAADAEPEPWQVPPPRHAIKAGGAARRAPLPMPKAPEPQGSEGWSLIQARAALQAATLDRDKLFDVALRYGQQAFEYIAAFPVVRGAAVGWNARGGDTPPEVLSQISIPLDAATVFRTVTVTRRSYVGPPPGDAHTGYFLSLLKRTPRAVFLFPIEVRSRVVAILYGDAGAGKMSQRRLADFTLFCQELAGAVQALLLHRKQRGAEAPLQLAQEGRRPSGWGSFATSSGQGLGRTVSARATTLAETRRPPPDFAAVLRRLVGPDAGDRARAMVELSRAPESSARELAKAFPGPTAWSRLPVTDLPEADELGPIPGALARLGRAGAAALAPLLDAPDSETRYLALLTAGNLPYAELVDGVLRGLFDPELELSSAARAAAGAMRGLPRFDASMKALRQELAARDPLRRALAARALGVLHDRQAIDGLMDLTASEDRVCAEAAAEALTDLTRETFGPDRRSWTRWWAENRGRRRVEWLVAALRHRDEAMRVAAIEELSTAFHDHHGYLAGAPPDEREAATKVWEAVLTRPPNQSFDL